jgi:hypothetical protein
MNNLTGTYTLRPHSKVLVQLLDMNRKISYFRSYNHCAGDIAAKQRRESTQTIAFAFLPRPFFGGETFGSFRAAMIAETRARVA